MAGCPSESSEGRPRSVMVSFRLTPREREILESAQTEGQGLSAYLRQCALQMAAAKGIQ